MPPDLAKVELCVPTKVDRRVFLARAEPLVVWESFEGRTVVLDIIAAPLQHNNIPESAETIGSPGAQLDGEPRNRAGDAALVEAAHLRDPRRARVDETVA